MDVSHIIHVNSYEDPAKGVDALSRVLVPALRLLIKC